MSSRAEDHVWTLVRDHEPVNPAFLSDEYLGRMATALETPLARIYRGQVVSLLGQLDNLLYSHIGDIYEKGQHSGFQESYELLYETGRCGKRGENL